MGNVLNFADEQAIQSNHPETVEVLDNDVESLSFGTRTQRELLEIYILSPDQIESLFQGKVLSLNGYTFLVMEGFE